MMPTPSPTIPQLTAEQAIIITGCTGLMCCDLDDFLVDLNERVKPAEPYTAQSLASIRLLEDVIKPTYLALLPPLLPVDWLKESKREAQAEQNAQRELAESQRPRLVLAK